MKKSQACFSITTVKEPSPRPAYNIEDIPVNLYICWSIFNLLCCNFFFGILGLYYSTTVKRDVKENRLTEVKRSENKTLIFNSIGTLLGIGSWVLVVILANGRKSQPSDFGQIGYSTTFSFKNVSLIKLTAT